MISSSLCLLRFIVWSFHKGQTPVHPGSIEGGNVSASKYIDGGDNNDGCNSIGLRFEKDRYPILNRGREEIGFCRFVSVKTVWDPNIAASTKSLGVPVTYITAQCATVQKLLVMFMSKASAYVLDKGK
jgi:hypothetical protein